MSAVYFYTARANDGNFVAGSLRVESAAAAIAVLRNRSLFVTSLEAEGTPKGALVGLASLGRTDPRTRTVFFRSIATMTAAGVAMRRALDVAIDGCRDGRFRETLRSLAAEIEAGTTLAEAMARHPHDFAPLIVSMARAGEQGGILPEVLERIAELLERHHAMRRRLHAALAYPCVVAVAAAALVIFLIANIVPAFSEIFEQMHVQLPLTTRLLIVTGRALCDLRTWLIGGAAVIFATAVYRIALRTPATARYLDTMVLAIPLLGSLIGKAAVARLSRTLGAQLRSGVALAAAIESCRGVTGAASYERRLPAIADALRNGVGLGVAFEQTHLFDPVILALLRCGEETGTLDAMLLRISELYDLEVETALAALGSVVEPLLIVVLGAVVGTIVGSILIPLYSVIGSIK